MKNLEKYFIFHEKYSKNRPSFSLRVEPPVHHKQSDGNLVAADDLYLLPGVPRHQADVQQAAARECRVESWRKSELELLELGGTWPTRYNEEKEDILIEDAAQLSLGGKFVGQIEGGTGEGQTEEK